jgi:hypothetical protein
MLVAEVETLDGGSVAEFVTDPGLSTLNLKLFPIVAYRKLLIGQERGPAGYR